MDLPMCILNKMFLYTGGLLGGGGGGGGGDDDDGDVDLGEFQLFS